MSLCICRVILPVLVIVLAWWQPSWANIALTVIGALLIILGLKRDFCCLTKKPKEEQTVA